MYREQLA